MIKCDSCLTDIESVPPAHCESKFHLAHKAAETCPEIEAMGQIITALRPLSQPSQLRVIRAAAAFFDIDLTNHTP